MKCNPIWIYWKEIKWKFFYLSWSFSLSFIILFKHLDTFLLVQTFPLIHIIPKRFICIHLTELFILIFYLLFYILLLLFFAFFNQQVLFFFSSSWTFKQSFIFARVNTLFYIFFNICYLSIHFIFIPSIIYFFFKWEIVDKYSLLRIEIESRIWDYFSWISSINFTITTFIIFYLFFIINLIFFSGFWALYRFFLYYKFQLIFSYFFFFSFFLTFDVVLQLIFLCLLVFFYEFLIFILSFFLSCLIID